MDTKECIDCGLEKPVSAFYKTKKRKDGTQGTQKSCKKCCKERREDSKPVKEEPVVNFSPLDSLRNKIQGRIMRALVSPGAATSYYKVDYLDISPAEYMTYIESQFEEGMSWSNKYGVWRIGYVVCPSTAKSKSELFKLFHYSNTRPVWVTE